MTKINEIFGKDLTVLNLGLASMAKSVSDQGVKVVDIDWQPPRDGLPHLRTTKAGLSMDEANQQVIDRIRRKFDTAATVVPKPEIETRDKNSKVGIIYFGATRPAVIEGLDELERTNKSTALVTLCIGGGMGTATIIERV